MSPKRIKVGDVAPEFNATSYNSENINLNEINKNNPDKKIVLIFSRYFGCPICQLDLQEVLNSKNQIEKEGGIILYITQSGSETANKFIEEKSIEFPVIPSIKEEIYQDYGLGLMTLTASIQIPKRLAKAKKAGFSHGAYEGKESQSPGQFVIDDSGKILHAKKGWFDLKGIIDALK